MNAPMYPEADQSAPPRPMTNTIPDPAWLDWRFWIALLRMSSTGPGATLSRLSISGWVAECPTSPSTDTTASSAGKMARTP